MLPFFSSTIKKTVGKKLSSINYKEKKPVHVDTSNTSFWSMHICCSKTDSSLFKTSNILWKHLLLKISGGALQIQVSLDIAEAWFSWSSLRASEPNCSTPWDWGYFQDKTSYQGNPMLVLANIVCLSFLCILQFILKV